MVDLEVTLSFPTIVWALVVRNMSRQKMTLDHVDVSIFFIQFIGVFGGLFNVG